MNFYQRPPSSKFKITHQPISAFDILPASPLHGYIRIFTILSPLEMWLDRAFNKNVRNQTAISDGILNLLPSNCRDSFQTIHSQCHSQNTQQWQINE